MRGECGAINNNDTVITCVTIFALPRSLALIVCPFESATPRRPVTANSRPTMMNTIQAGTRSSSTKQMKAAEMSSLSARGSRSLPKLVICLRRRAMYPSSTSVVAAERKISSASHSVVRTSPPRSSSTLRRSMTASSSGTKKILSTVRAFGRFMLLRRVRLPKTAWAYKSSLLHFGSVRTVAVPSDAQDKTAGSSDDRSLRTRAALIGALMEIS